MEKLLDAYFKEAGGIINVAYVVEEGGSEKDFVYPPRDKEASILLNKVLKTKDAILKNKSNPKIERIPGIVYKFARKYERGDFLIREQFVFDSPEPVEFKIYIENQKKGNGLYAQFEVEPGNESYSVERISIDSKVAPIVGNLSANALDENVEKYILSSIPQKRSNFLKRLQIF